MRELAKTEVVVKTEEVADNTGKKFTAENKMNRLKELRQVMLNLKRQEDYFAVAEKHGYGLDEKMLEVEGNGKLDPKRQKIVAESVKEHGNSQRSNKYHGNR